MPKLFNRISSFVVASQIDSNSNTDTETVAEIVAASTDGQTLVSVSYTHLTLPTKRIV